MVVILKHSESSKAKGLTLVYLLVYVIKVLTVFFTRVVLYIKLCTLLICMCVIDLYFCIVNYLFFKSNIVFFIVPWFEFLSQLRDKYFVRSKVYE